MAYRESREKLRACPERDGFNLYETVNCTNTYQAGAFLALLAFVAYCRINNLRVLNGPWKFESHQVHQTSSQLHAAAHPRFQRDRIADQAELVQRKQHYALDVLRLRQSSLFEPCRGVV